MTETKSKPSYRKYIVTLWVLFLGGILTATTVLYGVASGWFGELPTFEQLENPSTNLASVVYSSDQKVLGKYYRENRVNVNFEDINPRLVDALVATEDVRFFNHAGIDARGLARVLVKTVLGGDQSSGGGSTLTQQLAKMLFHKRPDSFMERVVQKLKEWVIAMELEKRYSKEEIITMYLNKFDFINSAAGINSAANVYFDTTPDSLRIEQAAMLVGMAKNPSLFNPLRRADTTQHRRNVVLYQMREYKYITPAEFDSLKQLPLDLKYSRVSHNEGLATYFREYLRGELYEWCRNNKKPDGEPYDLYSDGLRIYTTINSKMQAYAEKAVITHLKTELQDQFANHIEGRKNWPFGWRMSNQQVKDLLSHSMKRTARYKSLKNAGISADSIKKNFNTPVNMTVFDWHSPNFEKDTVLSPLDSMKYYKHFLQSGLLSMDPRTGYIKAWVGGMNYKHFKYDHVKQGRRQVGSTFKPFLYTVAVKEAKLSPCYKVPNVRVNFELPDGKTWSPKNADGKYGGMMTLKEGLATSTNCIAAYLVKRFGPESIIKVATEMGITSPIDTVPSICLGTGDVSLYEMVGAFSTFANKGMWIEPTYLLRIEDRYGNVIEQFEPETRQALDEETAYVMLEIMKGATMRVGEYLGTSIRLRSSRRPYSGFTNPIAAKTGTTSNQSDGWFMGLTPDLVTGVWTGCEDRSVHFNSLRLGMGSNLALPIWGYYMNDVFADSTLNVSQGDFEEPEGKLTISLDCNETGKSAGPVYEFDPNFD